MVSALKNSSEYSMSPLLQGDILGNQMPFAVCLVLSAYGMLAIDPDITGIIKSQHGKIGSLLRNLYLGIEEDVLVDRLAISSLEIHSAISIVAFDGESLPALRKILWPQLRTIK